MQAPMKGSVPLSSFWTFDAPCLVLLLTRVPDSDMPALLLMCWHLVSGVLKGNGVERACRSQANGQGCQ